MSSEQGDALLKRSEDEDTKSPDGNSKEKHRQMESKDQIDHATPSSSSNINLEKSLALCPEGSSKIEIDSGFNNPESGLVDQTDTNVESDDEDLHLQWEDDETDEKEILENPEKKVEGNPDDRKGNIDDNPEESIDENLLLESSDEIDKMDDVKLVKGTEQTADEDVDELLKSDDEEDIAAAGETNNLISSDSETDDKHPENSNAKQSESDLLTSNKDDGNTIQDVDTSNIIDKTTPSKEIKQPNLETDVNKFTENKNMSQGISSRAKESDEIGKMYSSSSNESLNITADVNLDHSLNKPDAMLEIPTQEVIDILDDTDISMSCTNDDDDDEEMKATVDDRKTNEKSKAVEAMDVTVETIEGASTDENNKIVINSEVTKEEATTSKIVLPAVTVSEDDWSEIERKLENFETSIIENLESNLDSTDVDVKSTEVTSNDDLQTNKDDTLKVNKDDTNTTSSESDTLNQETSLQSIKTNIPETDSMKHVKEIDIQIQSDPDKTTLAQNLGTSQNETSEPQFVVQSISMSQLMKDVGASKGITSVGTNSSESFQKKDQSIAEAGANALACGKLQSLSRVEYEVKTDNLHIKQATQVYPPLPIEQLLSDEKRVETSTSQTLTPESSSDSPDIELKPDDVGMDNLDIDIQPLSESPPETDIQATEVNPKLNVEDDNVSESEVKNKDDVQQSETSPKITTIVTTESQLKEKPDLSSTKMDTEDQSISDTTKDTQETNSQLTSDSSLKPDNVQSTSDTLSKPDKVQSTSDTLSKPDKVQSTSDTLSKPDNIQLTSNTLSNPDTSDVLLKSDNLKPTSDTTIPDNIPSTKTESEIQSKETSSKEETNIESQLIKSPSLPDKPVTNEKNTSENEAELSTSQTNESQPSTSKTIEVEPPTLTEVELQPSTIKIQDEFTQSTSLDEVKRTTAELTHLAPDQPDTESSDNLNLLAETLRVMEDDEEQDEEDDDEDDFYPDEESSNQMTAEHSEDSNPQNFESETAKDDEKETDADTPVEEKGQDEFEFDDGVEKAGAGKDADMDVDDVCEEESDADVLIEEAGDGKVSESEEQDLKTDIETVKISDTSDNESSTAEDSMLKKVLSKQAEIEKAKAKRPSGDVKPSPTKKLERSTPGNVLNFVDLEESSSEDDIQEVKKDGAKATPSETPTDAQVVDHVVTPPGEEAKSSETPDVQAEEIVTSASNDVLETPGTSGSQDAKADEAKPKHKFSLEIFNLDSDDEETSKPTADPAPEAAEPAGSSRCVNAQCTSGLAPLRAADPAAVAYYDAARKRRPMVCDQCACCVAARAQDLVDGIKEFTPLLKLDIGKVSSELVEISDSDSDEEPDLSDVPKEGIGENGAAFIEAELAKALNETWLKYKMDSRLIEAQDALDEEMKKLEEETKEIDAMLSECQVATDRLRNELYATFEQERQEQNALVIYDTPTNKYICLEAAMQHDSTPSSSVETRAKRRMSSAHESAAKRPAIPLGYAPLDSDRSSHQELFYSGENSKADDDKDIAVLKVSAESAPQDLPPPGELARPPLRADQCVYAMRNSFGSWSRAKILDVQGKGQVVGVGHAFTVCRVKLFSKNQTKTKLITARCIAYAEPAEVRMTIGTRVIALFRDPMNTAKRDTFYSGIVAEVPNPVNSYRYLVFFDDGYVQYVRHRDTRVVCECSPLVWEEVHPHSREFVRTYLVAYPERPMVRLHAGQSLKTEWSGKWWASKVVQVDASLVQVQFAEDDRTEWIYRGSTRLAPLYHELQAAERHRTRPMPRTKAQPRFNMPYVEYTRSDEQNRSEHPVMSSRIVSAHEREIRQRAVAKKSTAMPPTPTQDENDISRVVFYTPRNTVRPHKFVPHACSEACKRDDTLALKDLRTYNPLAKPLLSGWERQIVRFNGIKQVMYRAPCGRRVRNIWELHRYLRLAHSDMPVDLFDFSAHTHCLSEFVINSHYVWKKDLSHGKENVPVPCVNYFDDSLPEFCSYNTERTPTAGVPLNLDPEFLCGCDCTDDCEDKTKCACWKMTLEGARTIGLRGNNVGYVYKRLPDPLPSGIYECNSRCKCKNTCLNRVAQHPLQLKLQVFKTRNRGWGIRTLNDVPKGAFLCVYAGNLLTDATATMDGLNEGDEYLAELDYIEVVEQMKEGYEEDVPDADKRLDKKNIGKPEESATSSSEEEEQPSKNEKEDGDFCPGYIGMGVTEFSKRLRKRDKNKKEKAESAKEKKDKVAPKEKPPPRDKDGEKADEDCITISDDEEVREPSRLMAEAGMETNEFVSKYRSVRSHFGKDEACYIMDAKVQGNIGRYLNHSCMPNVFVQNVFVDTHDPRFPWVAFFALSHIKAGTELTWNYNYDVGSVPGKMLYCLCGAPNCRGRLL